MVNLPKKRIILIALLSFSFLIRIYGINWDLPSQYFVDEKLLISLSLNVDKEILEMRGLNPHFFNDPSFHIYTIAFLYGFLQITGMLDISQQEIATHVLNLQDISILYISARLISAIYGVLTVYLLYVLGRKAYGEKTGLLGAAFLSLVAWHVRFSMMAYFDSAFTFWVLLAIYLMFTSLKEDKKLIYAAICVGVATAVKYPGGALLIPLSISYALKQGSTNPGIFARKAYLQILSIVAIAYLVCAPYSIIEFNEFVTSASSHSTDRMIHMFKIRGPLFIFNHIPSLIFAMGIPLCLFGVCGFFKGLNRRQDPLKMITAPWIIFFYLAMCLMQEHSVVRYILPLTPFLSLYGAKFLTEIKNKNLQYLSLAVMLLFSLGYTLDVKKTLMDDDTRLLALNFINETRNKENITVVAEAVFTPFWHKIDWINHLRLGEDLNTPNTEVFIIETNKSRLDEIVDSMGFTWVNNTSIDYVVLTSFQNDSAGLREMENSYGVQSYKRIFEEMDKGSIFSLTKVYEYEGGVFESINNFMFSERDIRLSRNLIQPTIYVYENRGG